VEQLYHRYQIQPDKRPDGVTLIPWKDGRCSTRDVTVTDTMPKSYLPVTSQTSGAAAEVAVHRKTVKYAPLTQTYSFMAIAAKTMGVINSDGIEFLDDLGRRISQVTDDNHEKTFLYQRLSVMIQRYKAVAILGTFAHTTSEDNFLPSQLISF